MKVGLVLPMFSGNVDRVLSFAREAEELGYDGVFAFDHFFPPGAPGDRPSLEAFSTLAAVGARTDRVTVGTLVARARLRPAGLLAKMAAGLDEITGGRMVLGVGTGDPIDRPEHVAFGFPALTAPARRAHLRETVAAVKALLRGEVWPGGSHVPGLAGPIVPPPVTPGGPPVWLGAQSDEVVRLAATLADGWNGWGLAPGEFARKARLLRDEAGAAGREAEATWAGLVLVGEDDESARALLAARRARGMPEDGLWVGGADRFASHLEDLARAGATWAVLVPAGPADRVQLIAGAVLPQVARRP